jgi:hypothetical protein
MMNRFQNIARPLCVQLAWAISLATLGGCSGGETPRPEAVRARFAKRLDPPDGAPREATRLPAERSGTDRKP